MQSQEAIQTDFGRRIRLIRERRGLSQEKLGLMSGLSRTYMSSVDRGERNVSIYNVWLLAETLQVAPTAFFAPEEEFTTLLQTLTPFQIEVEHVIRHKSA